MNAKSSMVAAGLAALCLLANTAAFAHTRAEIDASADRALKEFYTLNPTNQELAGKAVGVLIFGEVTKGGAGVAGEYGEGVLRVQGHSVHYYNLVSGSVGLTLGFAKHREIIMFMTQGCAR